jgi:hypothetical protein
MECWRPIAPDQRGRHKTLDSALNAALQSLVSEHDDFFDSLFDVWGRLFPELPARPGRYENGKIIIYVRNAAMSFTVRPKLRMIAKRLSELPGAPKRIDLRLEVHSR